MDQARSQAQPTIDAQKAQNSQNAQQQAEYNRIGQTDAAGNQLNYTRIGTNPDGTPIYSQSVNLGALGQQFQGGFAGLGQQYIDQAGQLAGKAPGSSQDAFNQAYQSATAEMQPQWTQDTNALKTQLANQGIPEDSQAGQNALRQLQTSQHAQQNTLASGLQNQLWNQGAQGLAMQEQSLGLLQPGVSYGGSTLNGQFAGLPGVNVANTDIAGIDQNAYNNLMQQYQAQLQQQNAQWSAIGQGLGGLGGGLLSGGLSGMGGFAGLGKYLFGSGTPTSTGGQGGIGHQ
jgi:hypothetical protein